MSAPDLPLAGRVILLTRPAGDGRALAERLTRLGARVDCRPTIRLEPADDPTGAREAVKRLESFEWVVFTSVNGVRFFLETRREVGQAGPVAARIAAIGPGTARELERAGFTPEVVAADSRAEGLAAALEGRIAPGGRVLIVRPQVARTVLIDALREQGASPVPVVFYRNAPADEVVAIAGDLRDGRYDVAVFTAPSTLQRLLDAPAVDRGPLLEALGRVRLVAIGGVTAAAIVSAGLSPAAVAAEPGDAGITEAVASLFAS